MSDGKPNLGRDAFLGRGQSEPGLPPELSRAVTVGTSAEDEALARLRGEGRTRGSEGETLQTMVPLRLLDEKANEIELRIRRDLSEDAQAAGLAQNDEASRRRFRAALIWLSALTLLLVATAACLGAMFAYGTTNRERIERLERATDATR